MLKVMGKSPHYDGAWFAAFLLRVVGLVLIAVSMIILVPSLLRIADGVGADAVFMAAGFGTGLLSFGLILYGLGEGLRALRDIARNSFRPLP